MNKQLLNDSSLCSVQYFFFLISICSANRVLMIDYSSSLIKNIIYPLILITVLNSCFNIWNWSLRLQLPISYYQKYNHIISVLYVRSFLVRSQAKPLLKKLLIFKHFSGLPCSARVLFYKLYGLFLKGDIEKKKEEAYSQMRKSPYCFRTSTRKWLKMLQNKHTSQVYCSNH